MQVVPGVFLIEMPIPVSHLENVNTYLIETGEKCVLIDPGWPGEESLLILQQKLQSLGFALKDIGVVMATHRHPDHLGLAAEIRRASGAQVMMYHGDMVRAWFEITPGLYRKDMAQWLVLHGVPKDKINLSGLPLDVAEMTWQIMPDRKLKDRDEIRIGSNLLKVIWTPGHSPCHICLYSPASHYLITGDHVLGKITPHIPLNQYTASMGDPLSTYLRSLDILRELEVSIVLPAHGSPFDKLNRRIQELQSHHEQRLAEIIEILGSGEKTTYEIAQEMHWNDMHDIPYGENLSITQIPLAVGESLAHLELLRRKGCVEKREKRGFVYFRRS